MAADFLLAKSRKQQSITNLAGFFWCKKIRHKKKYFAADFFKNFAHINDPFSSREI